MFSGMWKRDISLYEIFTLSWFRVSPYLCIEKKMTDPWGIAHFFWFEYSCYLHDFKLFIFLSYWWNYTTALFSCPENLQFVTTLLMSKFSMPGPENSSIRCHIKHLKLVILFSIICYIYKTFFAYTQEIHLVLVLVLASTGLIFAIPEEGMIIAGAGGRKFFPGWGSVTKVR